MKLVLSVRGGGWGYKNCLEIVLRKETKVGMLFGDVLADAFGVDLKTKEMNS